MVITRDDNQVLCLQRSDFPEFWQSVTGSLAQGEEPTSAAWRELHEETGLGEMDGELIDCRQNWWFEIYPHWRHRYGEGVTHNLEHVFIFKCHHTSEIKLSKEHLSFAWLPKEQAIVKVGSDTNKKAIGLFL